MQKLQDNFMIIIYQPRFCMSDVTYPNESWKCWDKIMKLENTSVLSLSPSSRSPSLLLGTTADYVSPMTEIFRDCPGK